MNLKLDENLPAQLAVALRQLGHNVHTVPEENLAATRTPQSGRPFSPSGGFSSRRISIFLTSGVSNPEAMPVCSSCDCTLPAASRSLNGSARFSRVSPSNPGSVVSQS
jgi:hypothetical protein